MQDFTNYRTDQLQRLQSEIRGLAKECLFEVRLEEGILYFSVRSVEGCPLAHVDRVCLELKLESSYPHYVVIYKHRNSELTSLHKGKRVSTSWVAGFLKHNASSAKQLIDREILAKQNLARQNLAKQTQQNLAKQKPKKRSVRRVKCDACNGEGSRTSGDPIEGAPFEYCSTCRGAGYLDSNEQSSPNGPSS